jgi:methionyl-tRNA formyltransferase
MQEPFAYFGTPYVARDTLAALLEAGLRPTVVITSPDAPKGRGMRLTPCETKQLAEEHGIPVLTPEKLGDSFISDIAQYACSYALVVAYGKILPQTVIDAFPKGVLNVHYSLLPKYRGASPVEAALLADDSETGVSIQRMVRKMDAGDVLAARTLPISPDETIRELRPRLIHAGAELLIEILPAFAAGTLSASPQDESLVTFAVKIEKSEGELKLSGDAKKNWLKYRAYLESPGTYFFAHKGEARIRVKVTRASYTSNAFNVERIVPEGKSEQDFSWLSQNGWAPE